LPQLDSPQPALNALKRTLLNASDNRNYEVSFALRVANPHQPLKSFVDVIIDTAERFAQNPWPAQT
jgi:hypothetical protein